MVDLDAEHFHCIESLRRGTQPSHERLADRRLPHLSQLERRQAFATDSNLEQNLAHESMA
jgi:hypothetical protein